MPSIYEFKAFKFSLLWIILRFLVSSDWFLFSLLTRFLPQIISASIVIETSERGNFFPSIFWYFKTWKLPQLEHLNSQPRPNHLNYFSSFSWDWIFSCQIWLCAFTTWIQIWKLDLKFKKTNRSSALVN